MRVISGRFKSLALPAAQSVTRPTTDRTKEAIFSRLDAQGVLEEARVLDLFAGTGALGIEALSRGASTLVAVESSPAAAAAIRRTFTTLASHQAWRQCDMSAKVFRQRAEAFIQHNDGKAFDVIFCDPPYDLDTTSCDRILNDLVSQHLVESDSIIVFERSARSHDLTAPHGWMVSDTKAYGETKVWYFAAVDGKDKTE